MTGIFDNLTDDELAADWLETKQTERYAVDYRRQIEDELVRRFEIASDLDGTERRELERHALKIVGRIERKVDAEMAQELAAEHGVIDYLPRLFRWRPEIIMRAWGVAPDTVTNALARAITAKPGRPSFSIEEK
jgi:hypothetical protein